MRNTRVVQHACIQHRTGQAGCQAGPVSCRPPPAVCCGNPEGLKLAAARPAATHGESTTVLAHVECEGDTLKAAGRDRAANAMGAVVVVVPRAVVSVVRVSMLNLC
eukprot:6992773-Prymnesium_polylepis.1